MSRWPLEPLMALARNRDGERMSMVELSRRLKLNESTVQHWGKRGIPNEEKAERAAIVLGFDPFVVWPEMLDEQIAEMSKPCEGCGAPFVPSRKNHRFCTDNCRSRTATRRRYWADPNERRRRLESSSRYYQEAGDYVRAAHRRRYQESEEIRERVREQQRLYYQEHREALAAWQREHYVANKDAILARQKRYKARKKAEREALAHASDTAGDTAEAPVDQGPDETVAA